MTERRSVLVGRAAELATLARLVDATAAGAGGALLVTGEAGVGKSRLLGEVAARARAAGLAVLTGRAVAGGGTYRAVAQALAPLLRADPGSAGAAAPLAVVLGRMLPGAALDRDAPAGGIDPTVLLGEAVIATCRRLAGGRGGVLVLEDLHWADADTLALVGYLADALAGALVPLLLAAGARTESAAPGLAALPARPTVTTVPLRALDAAGVAALAAACRGGTPLLDDEVADLLARSDGLPYLVEELACGSSGTVPPTLAALVEDRLAGLPPVARGVVLAVAVIGVDPDWRVLAAVTGTAEAATVAALRAATERGLLAADGERLRFRHALTRDAVLGTLLPPERSALAGAAADVLDRGDPDERALAAELFVAAGRPDRAAAVLVDLARRDAARGALRSAADLLDRASAAGGPVGAVAVERVRVLAQRGRAADALEAGGAALETGAVVGAEHAELCVQLARAAVTVGRWSAAEQWIARAGRPHDPRILVVAADAAFGAGEVERAADWAGRAVREAESALAATAFGGPSAADRPSEPSVAAATLCEALLVQGRCRWREGIAPPEAAFRRAAQIAAEHGLTPWRVEALFSLGSAELTRGDPAAPSLAAAAELAERAGTLRQVVQAALLRAEAVLLVDGPGAAGPLVERAAAEAGRLRLTGLQAMGELMAATHAALRGDLAAVDALLAAARTRPDAPVEVAACAPVVRGLRHLLARDLERANALVDAGMSTLLRHGSAAPTVLFGLWVLLRTAVADRDAQARATLRGHHGALAAHNGAALGYAEAIAAGRVGDPAAAVELLARADALVARHPWWNRLLRLFALEAAVVDGWGDPVPALRADLAAHEQDGAAALARACRDLLRRAGVPTRRRGTAAVPPALRSRGVTGRETEVLGLVAQGLSNAEVARRLHLSPRTVETHVTNLLAKTGATGRRELGAWAETTG